MGAAAVPGDDGCGHCPKSGVQQALDHQRGGEGHDDSLVQRRRPARAVRRPSPTRGGGGRGEGAVEHLHGGVLKGPALSGVRRVAVRFSEGEGGRATGRGRGRRGARRARAPAPLRITARRPPRSPPGGIASAAPLCGVRLWVALPAAASAAAPVRRRSAASRASEGVSGGGGRAHWLSTVLRAQKHERPDGREHVLEAAKAPWAEQCLFRRGEHVRKEPNQSDGAVDAQQALERQGRPRLLEEARHRAQPPGHAGGVLSPVQGVGGLLGEHEPFHHVHEARLPVQRLHHHTPPGLRLAHLCPPARGRRGHRAAALRAARGEGEVGRDGEATPRALGAVHLPGGPPRGDVDCELGDLCLTCPRPQAGEQAVQRARAQVGDAPHQGRDGRARVAPALHCSPVDVHGFLKGAHDRLPHLLAAGAWWTDALVPKALCRGENHKRNARHARAGEAPAGAALGEGLGVGARDGRQEDGEENKVEGRDDEYEEESKDGVNAQVGQHGVREVGGRHQVAQRAEGLGDGREG
mmetsp:Transcript_19463/g.61733  ORF Transcript_19463/g.61733 Transcript_19463/m.61733 type:complete len:524 (-) Transcript_19463:902-2473(-)